MKRSDKDIDRLLHDWDRVTSTVRPPAHAPRTDAGPTASIPVSILLVAVVAVVLAVAVARLSPHGDGPAASDATTGAPVAAGTVTSAADDGRFRLTLTADCGPCSAGDAIDAWASVTFLGPDPSANVTHPSSPVVFSVREVDGPRHVTGASGLALVTTTFDRDAPVAYPWLKSGGTTGDPANDAFVRDYLAGPAGELRLPAGTWTLQAAFAGFLTTSVELRVAPATADASQPASSPDEPSAAPATPVPTAPSGLSRSATALDEPFSVTLEADRTTYREGEDILPTATVVFRGPDKRITVGHASPAMVFSVREVSGTREVGGGADSMCLTSTWRRDQPRTFAWQRSGSYSPDDQTDNDRFAQAYLQDGPKNGLRLPVGTWDLTATFDVNVGGCGPANPLSATIRIEVLPGG